MSRRTTVASQADEYESEAQKMLDRERQLIYALIKGMQDEDRINEWLEEEANNQKRKDIIAALNKQKAKL